MDLFGRKKYDENGFTTSGIHQPTGTKYDKNNLDNEGYYKDAYVAWEKHQDDKDEVN